jgi:uncharacterized repeat protein (TIGR04052 family)
MKSFHPLSPVALAALLAACGGGGDTGTAAPTPQSVSIQFAAVAGSTNTPVSCGTLITGLGSTPTDAQLTDLRIYLTDVQLVNDKGVSVPVTLTKNEWQNTRGTDSVTLIDLENAQGACGSEGTAATNALVTGTVPSGTYVGLKATVGVPEAMSHSDVMAEPAPLDIMAMGWSWQAGRKFAKIELNPVGGVTTTSTSGTSTVATYNLHQASTDCTGPNNGTDTCAKKNLAQFSLTFDAATQKVAIDIAELFSTSDIRTNQNDAVGCMSATSDLDCPTLFAKMGLNLATGGLASAAQTVFRPIAK